MNDISNLGGWDCYSSRDAEGYCWPRDTFHLAQPWSSPPPACDWRSPHSHHWLRWCHLPSAVPSLPPRTLDPHRWCNVQGVLSWHASWSRSIWDRSQDASSCRDAPAVSPPPYQKAGSYVNRQMKRWTRASWTGQRRLLSEDLLLHAVVQLQL